MPHLSLYLLLTLTLFAAGRCYRQNIAASAKPVTFTQGSNRANAGHMLTDPESEKILLAPNVQSTYVLQPH